jgi:diguanylate cyclase (GGDEF)-like protein
VVLPECNDKIAYQLLNDLRQSFASVHFSHEGQDFSCTISIGIACTEQYPNCLGAELLALADEAMYVAKRSGRNQVRVAPDDLVPQEKVL